MSLFDNWPFTNMNQLNLDWIIKTVKAIKDQTAADAETAKNSAVEAKTAATEAEASARLAESQTGDAMTAATAAANSAAESATRATEAAQSAAEAAALSGYSVDVGGFLYKTLPAADPATGSNREYLIAPPIYNVLHRVSGFMPSAISPNYIPGTSKNYHYEVLVKEDYTTTPASLTVDLIGFFSGHTQNFANIAAIEGVGFYGKDDRGDNAPNPFINNGNITSYCGFAADDWLLDINIGSGSAANGSAIVKIIFQAK